MKRYLLIICAVCAFPSLAAAYQSLAATVRVSSDTVYDYVVVGESPQATDGFDNSYDTFAPGGSLNDSWISAYIDHPEWNTVKSQFRGDIRSAAARQSWTLTVAQNLPVGTSCTISLDGTASLLPPSARILLTDMKSGAVTDLKSAGFTFATATGPDTFGITITQPDISDIDRIPVSSSPGQHDGDLDNDGYITIMDAYKVLRVAYGLDPITTTALQHGDMDGDGVVRLADSLYLLRKVAGTL